MSNPPTEIKTNEKAKEFIWMWLTEGGHSIEEKEDAKATFHLVIDCPPKTPNKQDIVQPKETPYMIVVVHAIKLSPEHIDGLRKMDLKTREGFIWSVQKELHFNENNYKFELGPDGILEGVIFIYTLYFDNLTRSNLHRAINLNYRSFLYLNRELNNKLIGTPTSDPSALYG